MRILAWLSLLFLLFAFSPEQPFFRSPVDGSVFLSGTFGELRPEHFHTGIDIKGQIGQAIYAIGDGFVSQISVDGTGYGNCLLIEHENGFTSLYAHLNAFAPDIAAYAKSSQYAARSFNVVLEPESARFPIKKGDLIGKMGMSGHAYGPHLHFEIRKTGSERCINPLMMDVLDIAVADRQKPILRQLKIYELDAQQALINTQYRLIKKQDLGKDTIRTKNPFVGFGLEAFDLMDGQANRNGIYQLRLYKNDTLVYDFEMNEVELAQRRYLNAHIDYADFKASGTYFNRCFLLPGNHFDQSRAHNSTAGLIRLMPGESCRIRLTAQDVHKNEASLKFFVKRASGNIQTPQAIYPYYQLPFDQASIIDNGAARLIWPTGSLYETLQMAYFVTPESSHQVYSLVHQIGDNQIPIHQYLDLSLRPNKNIPEELRQKAFIAYCGPYKRLVNCGGSWKDGFLSTAIRSFGEYFISIDDIAPRIQPIDLSKSRFSFEISDNVIPGEKSKGYQWEAHLDGHWMLMTYDGKKDRLELVFDAGLEKGEHTFRLSVWDAVGNESVFEHTFLN
ncbi:MAG TPA: M23 family metallopeptidase [Saprospiraceae bacterium]|nr:M23 family metallopeptidase [Saprospiraceae bacterium]HMQ83786.1 M23 family metallopeptidase [Saprospiraceae bacterium]